MPRQRLCKVCGQWHALDEPWPEACSQHVSRPTHGLSVPMVNFDTMNPVQSMTNGLYYDSKAALRAEYRRSGVVEVGNDVPEERPQIDWAKQKKDRKATIGKALSRAGFGA